MPGPVFQSGDRVALHTVEEEDLDAFLRARSDPDVRIPLRIERPGNSDTVEEFFEETVSGEDGYWFVVCPANESARETAAAATDDAIAGEAGAGDAASDDVDGQAGAGDEGDGQADDDSPPVIGAVMLPDVDESSGVADLAYWVLPEYQGEGFGGAGVSLLLEYGFDELRLHRVRADCLATNGASRGLLESLGFTQEGQFRDADFEGGRHVDVLRYGLLADEWRGA
jgi:RimJ/RimL family protein N-acetyltransferase